MHIKYNPKAIPPKGPEAHGQSTTHAAMHSQPMLERARVACGKARGAPCSKATHDSIRTNVPTGTPHLTPYHNASNPAEPRRKNMQ